MSPWILKGDIVFLLKSKNIKRFDIIGFRFTQNGITFPILKRVIAFQGESVCISNGEITINKKPIQLPSYIDKQNLLVVNSENTKYGLYNDFIVPTGKLFVLGDNTKDSYDSRYFGGVSIHDVIGRAIWLLRFL